MTHICQIYQTLTSLSDTKNMTRWYICHINPMPTWLIWRKIIGYKHIHVSVLTSLSLACCCTIFCWDLNSNVLLMFDVICTLTYWNLWHFRLNYTFVRIVLVWAILHCHNCCICVIFTAIKNMLFVLWLTGFWLFPSHKLPFCCVSTRQEVRWTGRCIVVSNRKRR